MPARSKPASNASAKHDEPLPKPDAEGAISTLAKMAEKPKVTPFQEVIQRAKEQIIAAFHQGYTRQDICDAMQDHGIKVTPRMLIEYVPEVRGGRAISKRVVTKRSPEGNAMASEFGNTVPSGKAALDDEEDEPATDSSSLAEMSDESASSTGETATATAKLAKLPVKPAAKSSARSATAKTQRKPITKPTTSKTAAKRSTTKR